MALLLSKADREQEPRDIDVSKPSGWPSNRWREQAHPTWARHVWLHRAGIGDLGPRPVVVG